MWALRTSLRLVAIVSAACLLASCSSSPAQTNQPDQPGQQGQPGQTDQTQPPDVTANGSGLSLVPVTVSTNPADAGFQNVDVFFGVRNDGTDIVGTKNGYDVTLAIAEGRTYSAGGNFNFDGPLPPGITVCGNYSGPFRASFTAVPAAATLQTLSMSSDLVSALDKPIGSCPSPSLGTAGPSAEARSLSQPSLPGFAMKFDSLEGGGQFDYKGATAAGFTAIVTVNNHATLDALTLLPFVITSKGFVVYYDNFEHFTNAACEDKVSTVGPGQSRDIRYCFLTVDDQGNDIGTPLGLLLVSASSDNAYGIVALPH